MIYTVTTSPSLDLIIKLQSELTIGANHRVVEEELRPGGKGINISIMLHNLGVPSTAFAFVAGFSGDELMRMTAATGVKTAFIRVRRGRTRINVKIKDEKPTSINGLGPQVSQDDINYLIKKISALTKDDYLVLAGTVPPSLPQDIYKSFFEAMKPESAPQVIVDTPADQFKYVLKFHPFLIKPNLKDLKDYLKTPIETNEEIILAGKQLQAEGARNVLISLGKNGAVFIDEFGKSSSILAPGGTVTDKTGAGDSMIAGFLAEYIKDQDLESAAYMSVATGSATALTAGLADKQTVIDLRQQMTTLNHNSN